jgi:alkaline phosphatase
MKKMFLSTLCILALAFTPLFAEGNSESRSINASYPTSGNFPSSGGDRQLMIFPIDRAIVLAGSIIDFKVEAENVSSDVSEWDITINGKSAAEVFGKAGRTGSGKTGKFIIWEGISFDTPAEVAVTAQAKGAGFSYNRTIRYEVWAPAATRTAKNVILMVGDGLGQSVRTAARIVAHNLTEGRYNGFLEMDVMDVMTAVTTSGMNSLVTDSANSASAYATGHKTSNNAMGLYTFDVRDYGQTAAKVENIVELAKKAGMSTGLVTTSEITDATPASMFAHTVQRSLMQNIVDQLYNPAQRPDVIMGGAAAWFWPKSVTGSKRDDETDMIAKFESAGHKFVGSAAELRAVDAGSTNTLLGLFHDSNMNVYIDKAIEKNPAVLRSFPDQPALFDMTQKAIDILSKNSKGFFLMVEGASIDKQLHAMDWERSIWDTIEFDKAIGVAKRFADINKDTLIIVVGDHNHSVSVYGTIDNSKSGRDRVRVYENALFPTYTYRNGTGFPDSITADITPAIGYGNHPDYYEDYKYHPNQSAPAVMKDSKAAANQVGREGGVLREGNLPYDQTQEVHSADDVTLTAYGAGSQFFSKTIIDNTEVFRAMINALGLDPRKFK